MTAPHLPDSASPPLTSQRAFYIGVGAAVGSAVRWAGLEAAGVTSVDTIPWVLLAINIAGTAILAAALVESRRRPEQASLLVDGLGSGFCGGLTTFSAFAVGTAEQLRAGQPVWAMATVTLMVAGGLAGASISRGAASRRVGAAA